MNHVCVLEIVENEVVIILTSLNFFSAFTNQISSINQYKDTIYFSSISYK